MLSGAEQSHSSKTNAILPNNDSQTSVPTKEEQEKLIYNVAVGRKDVDPPATNMMFMNYSDEMENLAVEWVKHCTEPNTASLRHPQRGDVGIFTLSYLASQAPSFLGMPATTSSLCMGYNYTTNKCNFLTTYYLQILWANTSHFGCAMKDCSIKNPKSEKKSFYMTCVFQPGGTVGNERPYKSGTPCTECPSGYGCYMNQCVSITSDSETTTFTIPTTSNSSGNLVIFPMLALVCSAYFLI
uniref:SCP domain-containing protein n=1 Tax=Mesocestoides corti TaxID=53468 RepID=A0A5K3ERW0_MESCO